MTMTTALTEQPARPEQLAGFNQVFARLQAAISRKLNYIESDPQWFENTHHRVATRRVSELEAHNIVPLPPSLEVKVEDEDAFGQMETLPIDELKEKFAAKRDLEVEVLDSEDVKLLEDVKCAPGPIHVEPTEPEVLEPAEEPMEEAEEDEEDEDDVDSVEGQTARIEELQRLIVHKDMNHDSGNLDSAYVSGSDFSADIHNEVCF